MEENLNTVGRLYLQALTVIFLLIFLTLPTKNFHTMSYMTSQAKRVDLVLTLTI